MISLQILIYSTAKTTTKTVLYTEQFYFGRINLILGDCFAGVYCIKGVYGSEFNLAVRYPQKVLYFCRDCLPLKCYSLSDWALSCIPDRAQLVFSTIYRTALRRQKRQISSRLYKMGYDNPNRITKLENLVTL